MVDEDAINLNSGVVISSTTNCGDTRPEAEERHRRWDQRVGRRHLLVTNYEQGAGTISGTLPVQINCGSLQYSGNGAQQGAGKRRLQPDGEMQAGQELTINAAGNNTNAVLQTDFTNKGSITLTCPVLGCSGSGGGGWWGRGVQRQRPRLHRRRQLTFAAGSGTDAGISGGVTNTGTIRLNQTSSLGGQVEQTSAGAELFVSAGTKLNVGEPVKFKARARCAAAAPSTARLKTSGGVVAPGAARHADADRQLPAVRGRAPRDRDRRDGGGAVRHPRGGGVATLDGTLTLIPSSRIRRVLRGWRNVSLPDLRQLRRRSGSRRRR